MIKFFYSTFTCATASHIVLEEARVEFTPVEVSWSRKLNVEELAAANPLGAVPTLLVDGKPISQSAAVMEYIADLNPSAKLLGPLGSVERAQVVSWVSFLSSDFQKSFAPFFHADEMASEDSARPEIKDYAKKNVEKYLGHINSSLEGKPFLVGSNFTIADAHLFVAAGWCQWIGLNFVNYRHLAAYLRRIHDRPSVQKVLEKEGMQDYFRELL